MVGRELRRCDLALARRRRAAPKRARRVRCLGSRGVARAQTAGPVWGHRSFGRVPATPPCAWPPGPGTLAAGSHWTPGRRWDRYSPSGSGGRREDSSSPRGSARAPDFSGWAGVEPRLTAVVTPDDRTRLGVGMGRSHQVVQSLFNEESALGTLLGFDVPVAGGSGGLPVARADQVEAVAGRRVGPFDFSVTGYVRRTRGLALGSVSTPGLFPADSIVVGRGYASGVIGALELEQGPALGAGGRHRRPRRRAPPARPDTTRATGRGHRWAWISATASCRTPGCCCSSGPGRAQPTSVVSPGFEWRPNQTAARVRRAVRHAGEPPGRLNGANLPDYARLDLGLRRTWHVQGPGSSTGLTTAVSVLNVLRPKQRARLRRPAGRRTPAHPRRPPGGDLRGRLEVLTAPSVTGRGAGAFL